MEWQPIETAPKNGEVILLANAKDEWVWTASYDDETGFADFINVEDLPDEPTNNPTHWMPLPEPPK